MTYSASDFMTDVINALVEHGAVEPDTTSDGDLARIAVEAIRERYAPSNDRQQNLATASFLAGAIAGMTERLSDMETRYARTASDLKSLQGALRDLGMVIDTFRLRLEGKTRASDAFPSFLVDTSSSKPFQLRADVNRINVPLGQMCGYPLTLVHKTDSNRTFLCWGCRTHGSEETARSHWANDRSQRSGEARPDAQAMISYVKALCQEYGWPW